MRLGFAVVQAVDFDTSLLPANCGGESIHGDCAAVLLDLARQKFRHLRIAAAHVEHAIAFGGVFDGLLFGQRSHADDSVIGGIKSLDKSDETFSAGLGNKRAVEIVGKGAILAIPIFERFQPLEVAA